MTPDRLRKWLNRSRPRAAVLRLSAERLGGDITVREWLLAELQDTADVAGLLLDVAQDYADDERQTVEFKIAWLTAEGVAIATTAHKVLPVDAENLPRSALRAADGSNLEKLLVHFMEQDTAKLKLMAAFLGQALQGMASVQQMQQQTMASVQADNQLLRQLLQAALTKTVANGGEEETEEAKAESLARAGLYNKLAELGPDVARLLLEAAGERFGFSASAAGGMAS